MLKKFDWKGGVDKIEFIKTRCKDKKVLDEELENLEWSHDFLTKKKAAAIVLLKAAYKKSI